MIGYIPYLLSLPYAGLIAYFSFGLYKKKYSVGKKSYSKPSISLIVACRNEEFSLSFLLDSIDGQISKPDEVIFVDDNSTDKTFSILKLYADSRENTKVINAVGHGKKSALIQAAEIAKGEFLMFTDADCVLNKKHIFLAENFLSEYNSDMLLGGVRIKKDNSFFNIVEKTEFASLQASTAGSALMNIPFICNGANIIIRRSLYLKNIDGININISSGDDVFMLHTLKKENKNIDYLYNEDFVVSTEGTASISKFIRQRIRWAGKSTSYQDKFSLFVSSVVAFTNIIILISYFFTPVMYLIKLFVDSLIMIPYIIKYKEKRIMRSYILLFPVMSVFYPLYIFLIGLMSVFSDKKIKNWK